ncbi:MAG TPA: molybdopterin converting factor subunit 1 [Rhodocyclaceae bacterium]|nr:molybdopterin converting factor subunit 1 [Rhodocyclaceae bacterium]
MKIRYFAWLRDSVGCSEEQIALPAGITNVGMLIDWLATRGEKYERAFEFIAVVMVFVNEDYADRNQPVSDDDEVLLVPPIAGG